MKSVDDIKIAEEALATLKRLRLSSAALAIKELESLGIKVRHTRPDQGDARHDTYIAVQKLRQELSSSPNPPNLPVLWQDAIAKMEAWRKWLSN